MKTTLQNILPFVFITLFCCIFPDNSAQATPPAGYNLVWSDEFNSSAFNTSNWNIETWWYLGAQDTPDALDVSSGSHLMLYTYTTSGTNYAGDIRTANKYEPLYGYFEARIGYYTAPGTWSCFWLTSQGVGVPSAAGPHAQGVEMDVSEHRKYDAGNQHDVSGEIDSFLHWNEYATPYASNGIYWGTGLNSGMHIYSLLWTPASATFSIDGTNQWTMTDSGTSVISHTQEYLLLTSIVQGGSWAGNVPSGGFGNKPGYYMWVDYVRAYQPTGAGNATQYETEGMTQLGSTGGVSIVADPNFSDGYGVELNKPAAWYWIGLNVRPGGIAPGTYNVKVGMRKNPNNGIFQMAIATGTGNWFNNGQGTEFNQGGPVDEYSPSTGYAEVDLGTFMVTDMTKTYDFQFTCINKNPSSTGYVIDIDYIKLTHQ